MPNKVHEDLVGREFEKLRVIKRLGKLPGKGRFLYWQCKCVCGKIFAARHDRLVKFHTKSCGCLKAKIHTQVAWQRSTWYRGAKDASPD
jgi:hypothetical protein